MQRRKKLNLWACALILTGTCLSFCQATDAQIKNWTVVVACQRQEQMLNYPGSTLKPIIKTAIEFKQADDRMHYEDLFYSHGNPIGSRRYHTLDVAAGSAGIIQVDNFRHEPDDACAAANAAIRVYMDLFSERAILLYITVQKDDFDSLVDGMEQYGFCRSQRSNHLPARVFTVLRVVSEPMGRAEEMLYGE